MMSRFCLLSMLNFSSVGPTEYVYSMECRQYPVVPAANNSTVPWARKMLIGFLLCNFAGHYL